ncbi:hypothetical protein V6N13_017782 [Hibiscus sabdariffa]|uniref:Uncharacterized protein n=1 Tax=Hibiscus sabdariffa TaxID=183260 RepID=A0ABR2CHX3_9ROSI
MGIIEVQVEVMTDMNVIDTVGGSGAILKVGEEIVMMMISEIAVDQERYLNALKLDRQTCKTFKGITHSSYRTLYKPDLKKDGHVRCQDPVQGNGTLENNKPEDDNFSFESKEQWPSRSHPKLLQAIIQP